MKRLACAIAIGVLAATPAAAEDGYDLWLRYLRIDDRARLQEYTNAIASIIVPGGSPTAGVTARELRRGLEGLLGAPVAASQTTLSS